MLENYNGVHMITKDVKQVDVFVKSSNVGAGVSCYPDCSYIN